jgi:FMN phosphatase YigB (HAD superfamily)
VPTLCVDVDSTVWDTGAATAAAVEEITGEPLNPEEVHTWLGLLDAHGEEVTTRVFDRVFSPAGIREREPYPGASEVLRALQEDLGLGIHFVTRNEPEVVGPHLECWLRERFGPGVGLTVTRGDKLGILRKLDAFGLVDDRPETLERAADAGLWTAAKLQPWNRDLLARRPDVHGFSDWRDVPGLLPSRVRRDPR